MQAIIRDLNFYTPRNKWTAKIITILFSLPFQLIFLHRILNYIFRTNKFGFFTAPLMYYQRVLTSCHIHPSAQIGREIRFPHPTGIVIGAGVVIGDSVTIYQGVTIGSHGKKGQDVKYPKIEDKVIIFANCVIAGSVVIGEGATIGAGSVVLSDIPSCAVAAGSPARVIRKYENPDK